MHPSVNSQSGRLFSVPTPIGNLEDITLRALRILRECDLILAEDTRTTGVLLKHHAIEKPLQAFHAHNEHALLPKVMRMLEEGKTIAQVSDAGTPGISDPGFLLARACAEKNCIARLCPAHRRCCRH
jgi:16S rRNA (cytidine1402-2'-O)-methyltransferase